MPRSFEVSLGGLEIFAESKDSLLDRIDHALGDNLSWMAVGVYASLFRQLAHDPEYFAHVSRSRFVYCDGQAVVWAVRLLGGSAATRSATTDLWPDLLGLAVKHGLPVACLGGTAEAVDLARLRFAQHGANVVFSSSGFWFDDFERERLLEDLAALPSCLVFVCLGSGLQESFAAELIRKSPAPKYVFTAGGLFDHISGQRRRAPRPIQTMGLEWLWRVALEPRRLFRRYLLGNLFFLKLFISRLADKRR